MAEDNMSWRVLFPTAGFFTSVFVDYYIFIASCCLFYYDYVLTFADEVRVIWGAPPNLAGVCYLAIRYGYFVQVTVMIIHDLHFTDISSSLTAEACEDISHYLLVANMVIFLIISAFVATRMFAMYSRNWFLGISLFFLGALSPCSITQTITWNSTSLPGPWPVSPCLNNVTTDMDSIVIVLFEYFPITLSCVSIVYESICLGLTAGKTFGLYKEQRRMGIPTTLTSLLLHDGSVYFGVLFVSALINITFGARHNTDDTWQLSTVVARSVTVVLTTRFIAHLRHFSHCATPVSWVCPYGGDRFLGSVSAPLHFGDDEDNSAEPGDAYSSAVRSSTGSSSSDEVDARGLVSA